MDKYKRYKMQRTTTILTILCLFLSACSEPQTQTNPSKTDTIDYNYNRMKNGQDSFDVGVHPSRKWARIVPISSRAAVTETLLVSMATEVSGCRAHLKGEVLRTIPNYTPDLAFPLDYPVNIDLDC
jgi:hypothetical protein